MGLRYVRLNFWQYRGNLQHEDNELKIREVNVDAGVFVQYGTNEKRKIRLKEKISGTGSAVILMRP